VISFPTTFEFNKMNHLTLAIMDLIVLEKKDWDEIKEDIKEIRKALENQGKMHPSKKWLTSNGAAEYLNVKVRTIYSYISKGILNTKKIGGILLINRDELESL
jgi:excisionase family DNA binding protein